VVSGRWAFCSGISHSDWMFAGCALRLPDSQPALRVAVLPVSRLRVLDTEVAEAMYDLGGGSAIYEDSPLQRRFRDAHTATAHIQVNPATYELLGRLLLGLPSSVEQL
jgi:alkylation response protein AidB-like acyl-CoA dehydrogenase